MRRNPPFGVLALTGGALLALAGCGTGPTAPRSAPPRPPVTAAIRALTPTDYVDQAGSLSLLAVQASQLAAGRAADASLRDFAVRQLETQRGVAAQLSMAGRYINLLPAARMRPDDQRAFDQLSAATAFDADYRQLERRLLERGAAIHRAFALSGSSATLRPVARMATPVFDQQLAEIRSLSR